jgi:hypothetical protein
MDQYLHSEERARSVDTECRGFRDRQAETTVVEL